MKAALFLEAGAPLSVEQITLLPMGPSDVRVRVMATALCHTDVAIRAGIQAYGAPIIMGHEACGVVEAVGDAVQGINVGDRVISSSAPSCGHCENCTSGHPNICVMSGQVRDVKRGRRANGDVATGLFGLGSFAEEMIVDQASVVPVRTDLPDAWLALIGCGVTTGLGAVLNRAQVPVGGAVAVIGCGAVGLAALQGARLAGASTIIGIDMRGSRRAQALELGATAVLDPASDDVVGRVVELTCGGVDLVVDAVGNPSTVKQAFALARRSGDIVIVGMPARDAHYDIEAWPFFLSEKRISSSLFGTADIRRDFPRFVRLAETGKLDLASLVTRTLALDEINEGLDALHHGDVVRAVVVQA
ncbi:MAG TPA: zinc-binding dehydrogenase [Rhizomicrobium sp.]|nr:zinc-binding dehydrogenase [Rhizomicrobium sp.]